jgi:flagellar hook-basal body complex protein FliE
MLPINGPTGLNLMPPVSANSAPVSSEGPASSFSSVLNQAFDQVNDLQNNAASQARSLALGQTKDIHSVLIATQKADVALELTTQVRNQIVSAYQEVMRMSM